MKTSSDRVTAMTAKPESPSQGACKLLLPCNNSSPSDGEPGGSPKPKKSSDVSVVMAALRMNGKKVSVAVMALGSTCLTMIFLLLRPIARAART